MSSASSWCYFQTLCTPEINLFSFTSVSMRLIVLCRWLPRSGLVRLHGRSLSVLSKGLCPQQWQDVCPFLSSKIRSSSLCYLYTCEWKWLSLFVCIFRRLIVLRLLHYLLTDIYVPPSGTFWALLLPYLSLCLVCEYTLYRLHNPHFHFTFSHHWYAH